MNFPQFQIFQSTANAEFHFRLRAANTEIILSSEGYKTKQSCLAGIEAVKNNAPFDNRYDRRDSTIRYSFNLKAANGEIIGRSETYNSSAAREKGIAAVKKDAPLATIEF